MTPPLPPPSHADLVARLTEIADAMKENAFRDRYDMQDVATLREAIAALDGYAREREAAQPYIQHKGGCAAWWIDTKSEPPRIMLTPGACDCGMNAPTPPITGGHER